MSAPARSRIAAVARMARQSSPLPSTSPDDDGDRGLAWLLTTVTGGIAWHSREEDVVRRLRETGQTPGCPLNEEAPLGVPIVPFSIPDLDSVLVAVFRDGSVVSDVDRPRPQWDAIVDDDDTVLVIDIRVDKASGSVQAGRVK